MKDRVFHEFSPIYDMSSKIIILGSFPSVLSRKNNFYYMNPQNRFWRILQAIYNDDFTNEDINVKIKLLKKHNIALYDVVESCTINKSDDNTIKNIEYGNIKKILDNSSISHIYLNGKKAYSLFDKSFKNLDIPYDLLPSSSSANAKYSLCKLVEEWNKIITS